jgi:large subunit ribosomal protein L16
MLSPKRTKYRKMMKGKNRGLAHRGSDVSFGDFGLQAIGRGRISSRQIEAGRMAIQRSVSRRGQLFIRVFPDKPTTKKPLETRMGKGKGPLDQWVSIVRPGKMLFEIAGVEETDARAAFKLASTKLPMATRFLIREEQL